MDVMTTEKSLAWLPGQIEFALDKVRGNLETRFGTTSS